MTTGITSFQSNKVFLKDILQDIDKCKIQLPDFQRGWVWDDNRIKGLLSSVSLSFPIGAVMVLETGNSECRFKPRPIEGLPTEPAVEPDKLILDGQQRLTALFQALIKPGAVVTEDIKKKTIYRHYYFDIEKCLNPDEDREECIRSIPEDKCVRNFRGGVDEDYSTPDKEYAAGLFPVKQLYDSFSWREGYDEYWDYDRSKARTFNQFYKEVIQRFEQYQLPVIEMGRETPKEAVCLVFEKVNTGGVSLTVFELLTATFAADNFLLRDDWRDISNRFTKEEVLRKIPSDDFLQAVTLLATMKRYREHVDGIDADGRAPAISCKRKDILKLKLEDYLEHRDTVVEGFLKAAKFLRMQKIFTGRDLPYRTQIVPLAATLAVLGDEADNDTVRKLLSRWYWCGVFGELYGSTIESRFAKDLPELIAWVRGGDEPTAVKEATFSGARLEELTSRRSAAYKGIFALMMRDGCEDFRSGQPIDISSYYDENVDIHHIFPQKWCKEHADEQNLRGHWTAIDCIINKAPLSARTNRMIGGSAPSAYLQRIEKNEGIPAERLDQILRSHVIDPAALRNDDFWAFYDRRYEEILDRVEAAMGKSVIREEAETA